MDDPAPRTQLAVTDSKLAEVVRRLVEAYAPERIYLFGSKARDDAGADSDYDVLVVVDLAAVPRSWCSSLPCTGACWLRPLSRSATE